MAVVTFARLSGSGGDEIAALVAHGLGYDLVDSTILKNISEDAGVRLEEVMHQDEKTRSKALKWLLDTVTPNIGKILREEEPHFNSQGYIDYLKLVMHRLAEEGNKVIVGRGGQFILRDMDNAFHVQVIANQASRIERIMGCCALSEAEALEQMKQNDTERENFIRQYFKGEWNNPLLYHLIVNTTSYPIEDAGGMIIQAVREFSSHHDYIPGVRERRKGERRKDERRKGTRRYTSNVWTVQDMETAFLKTGRPVRSLIRNDRRRVERRKQGRRSTDTES
jgi:cytidylate kinase